MDSKDNSTPTNAVDETVKPVTEDTTNTTPDADSGKEKKVPVHVDLGIAVKERIAGCGGDVKEVIVAALAKDEITRRTTVGEAAIRLEMDMAKDFAKIKPDVVEYTIPGDDKTANKRWSPDQAKKYQEAEKKLNELRAAINTAFEKFDKESWDKLEQKVKGLKDSAAAAEKKK